MFRLNLGAFALAVALVVPLAASAQTAPVPPAGGPAAGAPAGPQAGYRGHHRKGFAHALRGLNLSAAQKQQIAGFMKAARTNMRSAGTVDPQARRANMLALRRQIDGVLTPEQRTQFQANLSRERDMKRDHGPAPAALPQ